MRRKLDRYYSSNKVATWLLDNKIVEISGSILECTSGNGAISTVLLDRGYNVITNDIDRGVKADFRIDVLNPESWYNFGQVDWVITNPPFNILNDLLPIVWSNVSTGMALFVRKSITEPTYGRQDFLHDNREHLAQIIFCPRVSFTEDGRSDSTSCDWLIWTKERSNNTMCTWVKKWNTKH